MKSKLRLVATILLGFFIAGCANQLQVTYYSDPPGATLYAGDRNLGRAPLTFNYDISEADQKRGSMNLQGLTARWVSGASQSYGTFTSNLNIGKSQHFTLKRPSNAPGLSTDMNYALELEKLQIMQRQAQAAEDAAASAARAAEAADDANRAARNKARSDRLYPKSSTTCIRIDKDIVTCH
jgi:hypothetical protein